MNILLINQPLNNRGDESAHKGFVKKILENVPNVHIKCIWIAVEETINEKNTESFHVIDSRVQYQIIKPWGWYKSSIFYIRLLNKVIKDGNLFFLSIYPTFRQLIKYYIQSDYVVCSPGGICMGGFQDWRHLFMLRLAIYTKKPLVYYGRSFGPFPTETTDNKKFKAISIQMLKYFSFLSIRDKRTEELAHSMGIDNYVPTIDSAFLSTPNKDIPREINNKIDGSKYVVFVPNSLIWHYAYKDKVKYEDVLQFYSKIVDSIRKTYPMHKILMLPQTFGHGTFLGDDINLFYDIKNYCNDNYIEIIDDTYDSDIQQAVILNSEFVCGARYHSVVFAINQGVPVIALSYEHKIEGLLQTLGLKDAMIDITHIFDDLQHTDEAITIFEKKISSLLPTKNARLLAKSIADKCFMRFVDYLLYGKEK